MPDLITTLLQINKSVAFTVLSKIQIAGRSIIKRKRTFFERKAKLRGISADRSGSIRIIWTGNQIQNLCEKTIMPKNVVSLIVQHA